MSQKPAKKEVLRWGDLLAAVFLMIILQIAAGRLTATGWTKDLGLVQTTTLIASILGLTLGKSIFKKFWVVVISFVYGIILIPWQLGVTLDLYVTWRERLIILWGRLEIVLREVLTREPVTDNILFLLLMAMLFWALSIYAGYVLIREGNPWKTIIPGGITVFVIHSFDPILISRSWYLAFYLFFALLLVTRVVYIQNSAKWRENRTHTPTDMGFDFSRVALILSLAIVIFAWNIPVVAETFKPAAEIWQTASKPWLTAKDRLSFMFASLRASVGLVQNFYGDTLSLGLSSKLSDQVVLEIQAESPPPNGDRYYWEARSYDTYIANQWSSTDRLSRTLSSDSPLLNQPGADVRTVVSFTFFPHDPISNLYITPEFLWTNRPSKAFLTGNSDKTVDFTALMSQGFVRPGDQYNIQSALEAATVTDLKYAGTDYPQWVKNVYLQLPNTITPRTKELALQIASGLIDPYDITEAITNYLRDNITYNQDIKQPPPTQDRIDWFLFDYRQGFCNYYATAEVIMLRSLGIPARMGVGFAQGVSESNSIPNSPPANIKDNPRAQIYGPVTYVVRQKDAHAWPEVFFPGIGWVIFEPTVSQPPLVRPLGDLANNADTGNPSLREPNPRTLPRMDEEGLPLPDNNSASTNTSSFLKFFSVGNVIKLVILIITIAILIIVIWQVKRGFRLVPFLDRISKELPGNLERGIRSAGMNPPEFLIRWVEYLKLPPLSRAFLEINRALNRMGKKPGVQDTPNERTSALISSIPSIAPPARRLSTEYQASIYSPHQADVEKGIKASKEIRYISWVTRIRRFLSHI